MRIWASGGEAILNLTTTRGIANVSLNCTLENPGAPFSSLTPVSVHISTMDVPNLKEAITFYGDFEDDINIKPWMDTDLNYAPQLELVREVQQVQDLQPGPSPKVPQLDVVITFKQSVGEERIHSIKEEVQRLLLNHNDMQPVVSLLEKPGKIRRLSDSQNSDILEESSNELLLMFTEEDERQEEVIC